MLCFVLEDRRDGSGEGARDDEPDDGEWFSRDLKPSRMVDLDGQRKGLFFSSDMLVAHRNTVYYLGPFHGWSHGHIQVTFSMRHHASFGNLLSRY